MSTKSKKRKPTVSMNKCVTIAMVIFIWAWVSVFQPSSEDMDKLKAEIDNIRDSVASHRLNIWEVRQALKDEFDWEVG